ncbi:MAG: trypsin-like peptidase domain-containing protein [Chloroflexota bacterium]|nr:trypsin-like peptidase domain-containing protein [Chloroflexota bacterium]MDE2968657.1 trypsin-like peptidase domain-containing protein [Chloroflexota bacterium]
MSAGFIFYLGAALVFLVAACTTPDDPSQTDGTSSAPPPTPTPVAAASPVVTNTALDVTTLDAPSVGSSTQVVDATSADADMQLDAMDIVAAREEVLSRIYEESLPSIVYVRVVHRLDPDDTQFGRDFFGGPRGPFDEYQHGAGSGFVWDEEGHILTNWHVVEGSDSVSVVFHDGEEYDAEFLGGDPDSDLAVLKIDAGLRELKPLPRSDLDEVRVGQLALAIGSPFGQDFTLTSGIVSALGRTIRGSGPYSIPLVVQTDAPINPGNSGGPLLDRQGRVIGINTQIISNSGANSGVGFAVPIDIAKMVTPDLIAHGKYEYAWLGISGTTLTSDAAEYLELPDGTRGVLVVRAIEEGPASEAGLRGGDEEVTLEGDEVTLGGDVITSVDGATVTDMHDLISYLVENTRPGDVIDINVLHSDGEKGTFTITLGTRPEN